MWLLPMLAPVARAAAFIFYRITYAGDHVPARGPLLLVANHPNSLLDPIIVVAAARRPVRFLAKAPLFDDPKISWAVKAAGAIPVYRRHDEGTKMERNVDAFRAVNAVLESGDAVGIFPEGISHNAPAIAPLKTGAARIALGSASQIGGAFPIVPIGMVMRDKDVFGSQALAVRGAPIAWSDLAMRGTDDAEAVRLLTTRIDDALRAVTVNLEAWEDGPLVECAVGIWEAERGEPPSQTERVARLQVTTRILAELRASHDADGGRLAADVADHNRRLQRLGLEPADLKTDLRLSSGATWAARRLHLLGPPQVVVAVVGWLLFWVPYKITAWIVGRFQLEQGERSTWKLMIGMVTYFVWILAAGVAIGFRFGVLPSVASVVMIPAIGVLGLVIRERWRNAWSGARRFFTLRSRRAMVEVLRVEQRGLSVRLEAVYQASTAGTTS
ncbi:MAG: 1-acyl-sn-glycerol-3-phosphate acyltransferase [Gemmatimonadaceae bacterium]